MTATRIRVSGVGCSLVDRLYKVSFSDPLFKSCFSRSKGDGGLSPGMLVFREDFERFCGERFQEMLQKLTAGKAPEKINIGGPSVVSMIHAAQLSVDLPCDFHFYGMRGDDGDGDFIMELLEQTTLNTGHYRVLDGETPSTVVLSDPDYARGDGERLFINTIGAAREYVPAHLDASFYASDIVALGATALVPGIHDGLAEILARSRESGCITLVNTVYDFRNEQANPHAPWPLGRGEESYRNIDLLVCDQEESLRLSGTHSTAAALEYFRGKGLGALVITRGAEPVLLYSDGSLFAPLEEQEMPVSGEVARRLRKGWPGDATGCGDNFAGGVLASLASQLHQGIQPPDLMEACAWGIVSGGAACFYLGGMYQESRPGEKLEMIAPLYQAYIKQLGW